MRPNIVLWVPQECFVIAITHKLSSKVVRGYMRHDVRPPGLLSKLVKLWRYTPRAHFASCSFVVMLQQQRHDCVATTAFSGPALVTPAAGRWHKLYKTVQQRVDGVHNKSVQMYSTPTSSGRCDEAGP